MARRACPLLVLLLLLLALIEPRPAAADNSQQYTRSHPDAIAPPKPTARAASTRRKRKPKPKPSPVVNRVTIPKVHGPVVQTTLTTHYGQYSLRQMPSSYFVSRTSPRPTIVVNDRVHYQKIIGFGGAMTDTSAYLLQNGLTAYQRNLAMQRLFSAKRGIGLTVTRVPIGASDFSATGVPYTYDDNPSSGQTCSNPSQSQPIPCDPALADFSISHDQAYIIPALAEMLGVNRKVKVLSTEWSPPPWMKANDQMDDLHAAGALLPGDVQTLANYFVKFIRAYKAGGIPIWAITPENEPQSGAAFPAMYLPAAEEARFITQNLRPALNGSGLHPLIFGMDGASLSYAQALEQSGAASSLAGMAWHCYGGQQQMGLFHHAHPHVVNLTSECSPGIVPYEASETALSGLNNSSSLIQLWNLALDPQGGPVQPPNSGCTGCRGIITIDPSTRTASYRLNYYELGQFSKFIRPGARRVQATRFVQEFTATTRPRYGVTPGLDDVAAVNSNHTRVLVVYNNSTVEKYFAVQWRGQTFNYKMPGRATVTFTWRPPTSGGTPVSGG